MTAPPPRLAYVGWAGNGNMGDEALWGVFVEALAPAKLVGIPRDRSELLAYGRACGWGLRGRPRLLLGGGTFIGSPWWRELLERSSLLTARRAALMVGTGVVSTEVDGPGWEASSAELARWAPLLDGFAEVLVRGPLSADRLGRVGIDGRVVGDPALLVARPRPLPEGTRPVLGVNVGAGATVAGGSQRDVVAVLVEALAAFHRAAPEWSVRIIGANVEDVPSIDEVAHRCAELGMRGSSSIEVDPGAFLEALHGCTAFVGERLHSVVLASALGIPSVMLAYSFKCLDFMASIDRSVWALPTDALDAEVLAAALLGLAEDPIPHARAVAGSVAVLQGTLGDELRRIVDLLVG